MPEEYPHLANAPITEALIDIRVKLPSNFDVKEIEAIHESIKEQYPVKKEQRKSEFRFEIGKEEAQVETSKNPKISGYRFETSDGKQILQMRLDGFTFSRLKPYNDWEKLLNEARRLWELYKDITRPELITRVAVRYINNLNIPMPIIDFGDYLTAPPVVPAGLPQGVSSFLNRVVVYEPARGAHAIITQALEQFSPEVAPIILDIDVFKNQPKGIDEKDAWDTLEHLRNFKNDIFFKSITLRLREGYE